jgi:YidC/Oxa1 family membrane protein insertase
MLIWSAWQQDYNYNLEKKQANTQQIDKATITSDLPDAKPKQIENPERNVVSQISHQNTSDYISVETDVYSIKLSKLGGTIASVQLLKYPLSPKQPNSAFDLMSESDSNLFIAQSGLLSDKISVPNHKSLYQSSQKEYRLTEKENQIDVELTWIENQIKVTKTYKFTRGSYEIELEHKVENNSKDILVLRDYRQFVRSEPSNTNESAFIYTYTGGAIYSPEEKFSKLDFNELATNALAKDISGGWIAMMQHYFLGAFIPTDNEAYHFYSKKIAENKYILGLYSQVKEVKIADTLKFTGKLWVGPKLQDQLEVVAPGLDLTTDYGWLTVIAKPLFWLLKMIHDLVANWGWSIVILTILIKLAFYRLSAASYRSMAGMRKLTPKLQQIKERYGDDKEKFNKAMMELYQKEKINPVGGCLPILVQIPVFIALYWVLLESVELRNAPFILWIDNLSEKDPYYILPLIMGISMYIQQKLNPPPPDPMQAKIMMSLPFIFTVFFAFFPSGLVLYWVVNNLLSILQQWRITKLMEEKGK